MSRRSLQGGLAVVSGASSGIGRAIAMALTAEGMALLLLGRSPERLAAVASQAGPGQARWRAVDLAQPAELGSLADDLVGDVNVLVHAAGVHLTGPLAAMDSGAFDRLQAVNVQAPFRLTQLCLPGLRRSRGQVVFVNSSQGLAAGHDDGLYAATKHALKALADTLRQEVNADGIRVLSVFPGRTATPMQAALFAREGRPYAPERLLQPEDVAAIVMAGLTMPPTAEVTDVMIRPMQKA